jgi:hypothetical protein
LLLLRRRQPLHAHAHHHARRALVLAPRQRVQAREQKQRAQQRERRALLSLRALRALRALLCHWALCAHRGRRRRRSGHPSLPTFTKMLFVLAKEKTQTNDTPPTTEGAACFGLVCTLGTCLYETSVSRRRSGVLGAPSVAAIYPKNV